MKGEKYIGKTFINRQNSSFTVIEYINTDNICIIFNDNGIIKNTSSRIIDKGGPIDPMKPSVYNIGYIGYGKYNAIVKGVRTREYDTWHDMLRRCYDEKISSKHTTYLECEVCKEWHNFQNFAEWYNNNFYQIKNHRMNLDKDILLKGNKIYCPERCVFVDDRINKLFIKSNKTRGELPIGVKRISKNSYYAYSGDSKIGWITKPLSSIEEAFNMYKDSKEKVIKSVAEEYKNLIPYKLYIAMINYQVEITD